MLHAALDANVSTLNHNVAPLPLILKMEIKQTRKHILE